MTTLVFTIERWRSYRTAPNLRQHHMAVYRARQALKQAAWVLAANEMRRMQAQGVVFPWPRARVVYYTSSSRMDADNIIAAAKPIPDALIGLIIPDDGLPHLNVEVRFGQYAGPKTDLRVEVVQETLL